MIIRTKSKYISFLGIKRYRCKYVVKLSQINCAYIVRSLSYLGVPLNVYTYGHV